MSSVKIVFIGLILLCFMSACANLSSVVSTKSSSMVSIIQQDRHYKITVDDSKPSYDYYILDDFGNIVDTGHVERMEPDIQYIASDILEIRLHGGTYADICKYYNIRTNEFSKEYENPFLVRSGLIVYYDADSKRLIIRDIFDEKVFYKDFIREISVVVPPEHIELRDNNSKLDIRYYKSQDEIVSETLNLK